MIIEVLNRKIIRNFLSGLLVIILFFTFGILTNTKKAHSQEIPVPNLPTAESFLTIRTNRENPGPNQKVTASLDFNLSDLKKAEISWLLNGKLIEKKIGKTSFDFKTGESGSLSRVTVTINTFEGDIFQKEISIRIASVDMVSNAETYTPPFYQGRSLYTDGANIKITAIPNFINSSGQKINSSSLIYKWQQGNSVLSDGSGIGKSSIIIPNGTISRPLDIRVEVTTLDNSIKANGQILVQKSTPEVLIYEKNPLFGLLINRVLSSFSISEKEIVLEAVPYFFSTVSKNASNIEYAWTQNSTKIESSDTSSSITLRQTTENLSGQVNIGVRVLNNENQLQNDSFETKIMIDN